MVCFWYEKPYYHSDVRLFLLNRLFLRFSRLIRKKSIATSNLNYDGAKKFFATNIGYYFTKLNNFRKLCVKKYIYTINHKKIAINYFFFSL